MKTKAYAYVRFSTLGQADGDSLNRQLSAAEAFAEAHDLELDTTYRDTGVSGFSGANRKDGALARFLAAVLTGVISNGSYLIIESFDRLSREPVTTALQTFTGLSHAGIAVVTTQDGAIYTRENLDAEWHRLIVGLMHMASAHQESEKKSIRTRSNWKARRERGLLVDRLTKPAWLDVVDGEFVVIEERRKILIRIFEEMALGHGADTVARRLNADGVASWGAPYKAEGKRAGQVKIWHGSYLQNILNGREVLGEHQPRAYEGRKRIPVGDPIVGYFPAVIEVDLYHRARASFKGRGFARPNFKGAKVTNLLDDLGRCAHCGSRMRLVGGAVGFNYLKCASNVQRTGCDHDKTHRYQFFERVFFDWIAVSELGGQKADDTKAVGDLAEVRHQLNAAKAKAAKTAGLVIEMDSPALRAKLVESEVEVQRLVEAAVAAEKVLDRVRSQKAPNTYQEVILRMSGRLDDPDVDQVVVRKKLIAAMAGVFDRVTFDQESRVVMTTKSGVDYVFKLRRSGVVATISGEGPVAGFAEIVDQAEAEALKAALANKTVDEFYRERT